jgi:hypothetical protein
MKKRTPIEQTFYTYFNYVSVRLFDVPKIHKDIERLLAEVDKSTDAQAFDATMKKLVEKWRLKEGAHIDERSHYKAAD